MMHFALTFNSQLPRKKYWPETQNMTSSDIVQPISKHIPTPSLVSLSDLSIIFYWVSLFSLESHLTGEPCDYFLYSIIVARNYVLACIFCIVRCQQISIWNKQIKSSIYLIKQVGLLFKIWWSEEQRTQKIKILNWGTGEHSDSFHRNKWTGTHWEGVCQNSVSPNFGHNLHLMELFWYDNKPFS